MVKAEKIEHCRSCDSENLVPVLSLGNQYVTNFINSEKDQRDIPKVPLDLVLCGGCKILQLRHNAPPEAMWNDQYWYKSGISSTIRDDLKDIVNKAQQLKKLERGNIVIDIGCNDGTLFDFYRNEATLVGFEPSKNVAREAESKGYFVINDFFNSESFKKNFGNKKAKIITAISMFYDLEKPNKFLEDIISCLDNDGLFVIQQNYLVTMLEQNAFDNICHEHREYYSLGSLENILKKYGLEIFDVEQNSINGGSIRTYMKLKNNRRMGRFKGAEKRIRNLLEKERKMGLTTLKPYQEFASRIFRIKDELTGFLNREKRNGKRICIYGASTRGNVALQYFGLGPDMIDCIADKNPDKWGKKTVGSLIPIVSPKEMRKLNPDYLLVNTWHFFDEIKEQEKDYYNSGGKFLVALPRFKIV